MEYVYMSCIREMMMMMMIIPGKHEVKELHKTVILGTAHILRKVLM